MKVLFLSTLLLATGFFTVPAFAFTPGMLPKSCLGTPSTSMMKAVSEDKSDNKLLDDFRTSWGELIDPYKTLKVHKDTPIGDIKRAYYTLSKRYHPDGRSRFNEILPGSCNNMDEVREEWERIRMSYEILSDKRLRKKYERHTVMADPEAAVKQAAMDAAWSGVASVGKGVFDIGAGLGAFAFDKLTKKQDDKQRP